MKKFIKWFIFWLLVLGGMALAICYVAIPQETKSAMDIVIGYLNTPLGIAGGTTITIGLVVGVIIKVVYDRYRDNIHEDLIKAQAFASSEKEKAEQYKDTLVEYKEQVTEMLNGYSQRIDYLTSQIIEVCETSPNAKVKALGEKIKNGSSELKTEIKDNLEKLNNDFVSAMNEKVKLEELENKINSLTEQLERLVNDNGREETTND